MIKWIFIFVLTGFITGRAQPTGNTNAAKSRLLASYQSGYLQVHQLAEEIEALIRKHGLYKDSVDWNKVHQVAKTISNGRSEATTRQQIIDYFTETLREAGDKHSFFITAASTQSGKKKDKRKSNPSVKYLGSGIAVVTIPYCFHDKPAEDVQFANNILDQIRKVDTRYDVSGWIVDLRGNVGGNMWPMLAGLNALIKDGTAGYFINPASNAEQAWPSVSGALVLPKATVSSYKVRSENHNIAVLIDSLTASSGEMTAISLLGLPGVKVFGQPSAGYTTANTTYFLSDGTMFNLATSLVADRNKKVYREKIIPEIILPLNSRNHFNEGLQQTKQWLTRFGLSTNRTKFR